MADYSDTVWNKIWQHDSYSDANLRKEKARYKVNNFCNYISINPDTVCADLGCGGGYISSEIATKYKCNVIGLDFSDQAIKIAKSNCNNLGNQCQFIKSSLLDIQLLDNSIDIVLCIGVLEHIKNIDKALSEIKRILKPSGYFVIVSSNCYSFMYFDRLIKQILGLWKYGFQKNWSPKKLSEKLQYYEFNVHAIDIFQGMEDFPLKNKLDNTINKIIPIWGRYFQIIGRKM